MSTIQRITSFNSTTPVRLKQNNSNNTIIEPQQQDKFVSSPSFKGGMKTTTPNAKKGLAAFFTSALAAIGLIEKEPRTEEERVKIEYRKTQLKNPEFVSNLESTKVYTKAAIVTLAKYKEEDPEFAYELSKIFKTLGGNTDTFYWNLNDSEYLAKKFKENPELVQKYHKGYPATTVEILRAKDIAPGFADRLYEQCKNPGKVLGFAQIYSKNPQAAIEISQNEIFNFGPKDAAIIAKDYDKNKEALDTITKTLKTVKEDKANVYYRNSSYNPIELINTYNLYPKEVISMILEGHSSSRIAALAEAKAKAPRYYDIGLTDLTKNKYQLFKNNEEIKEFALNAQKLDKQITQIERAFSEQFTFALFELKPIVEKFKDHPEALDRIIEDGRAKLDITKLADLYINNPNKIITDKMVKITLDPIGKFFFD